ncbi:MAG: sulfatase-like hydrolase/transferase [Pseudomonadota bacterium]
MTTQPNILFLFPDQHRGDWLGCRDDNPGVRTPMLDALAARGTHFTNALTPSPLCSPARACLAYGVRYDAQGVRHNQHDVDVELDNGYRALANQGYHVLACGKFDLLKSSMDWGVNGQHGEGSDSRLRRLGFTGGLDSAGKFDCLIAASRNLPEPYADFLRSRGLMDTHFKDFTSRRGQLANYTNVAPTPLPDDAYCDNWIGARAETLINEVPAGEPWFLQVNFTGPHDPLDVTESMHNWYDDVTFTLPSNNTRIKPDLHQQMRRNYAAMIENIDRWVDRLIDAVDARGDLDNTIIVYASDHGEELGDHDHWAKCLPTRGSTHVPLIMAGPGVSHQSITTPVDLVDLHATFIDFAGAEPVAPEVGGGTSLTSCLSGEAPDWQLRGSGLGSWRMLFDGRYKYVHNHTPETSTQDAVRGEFDPSVDARALLYDLHEDPGERTDLLKELPDKADELRTVLLDDHSRLVQHYPR